MPDEHQLDDSDFGIRGIEKSAGYSPMPMASPAPTAELPSADDLMSADELAHARRPNFPEPDIREYHDVNTGEPTPENQTVSAEQAAHDIENVRKAEREALEAARNQELDEALRAHETGQQPAQETDHQPQPEIDQPQLETMNSDAAYAQAQDAELERLLQNPVLRERVTAEYQQMASAVEQTRQQYGEAATLLSQQVDGLLLTQFPELRGVVGNPQATAGALQVLARENPQRFAELAGFVNQASVVTEHAQRAQAEQRQAQAQQHQAALDQYGAAEVKRFEAWSAKEGADVKAVRENLAPVLQKHYGIDATALKQIHDGKVRMDGATLLRSAEFQAVLTDAIRFRLAQQGVTQARHNPVKPVMRPGVSEGGPTTESDYASLERSFRGKDLTAKQAADLLIAHRGRR